MNELSGEKNRLRFRLFKGMEVRKESLVYLENEVKQNSKTARVASISEEAMSSIFTYVKVDPALILNNIHNEFYRSMEHD